MNGRAKWGVLLAVLAASCAHGGEDDLSLRDQPPDQAALSRRLREMQRVRVIDGEGAEALLELHSPTQPDLIEEIHVACQGDIKVATSGGALASCGTASVPEAAWTSCTAMACAAQIRICAANKLLEIADNLSETVVGNYRVPPQTRAVNAALREEAIVQAREASIVSGEALRRAGGGYQPIGTCAVQDLALILGSREEPNFTVGQSLAGTFVEAYETVWEAAEGASADNIAVADSHFAREPSTGDALWMRWHGPVLSYDRVADFLLGARTEVRSTETGVCADSTPALERPRFPFALGFLQLSGIQLDVLGNREDYRFEQLWTGATPLGGIPLPGGPMRERIAERMGDDSWASMASSEFLAITGTTESDFSLARARVSDQAAAFARTTTQTYTPVLTAQADGSPTLPEFTYYSATTRPPRSLGSVHAARAFGAMGSPEALGNYGDLNTPTRAYARRSVAGFVDWAATVASEITRYSTVGNHPSLNALAAVANRDRPWRVRVSYWNDTSVPPTHFAQVSVYGDFTQAELLVVRGDAGVSCATTGAVEGEPCALADHEETFGYTTQSLTYADYGFETRHQLDLGNVAETPLYVLRRRPGSAAKRPGAYELIAPVVIDWTTATTTATDVMQPVVPLVEQIALSVTAPDEESCDSAEVICTGDLRSARIPLEDQLSEDGDAYESSWRHYLTLARNAATRADELGEALLTSGLGIEGIVEGAADQLEAQCGVAPDLLTFGSSGIGGAPSTTCTTDASCATIRGGVCVNGRCGVDPVRYLQSLNDPRAQQLAECLGEDADQVVPFVALGPDPLCMWRHDSTGVFCGGGLQGRATPCPFVMRAGTCASSAPPGLTLPAGYSFVSVSDTIGVIPDTIEEQYEPGVQNPADCDVLRSLRTRVATDADLERLRQSSTFDLEHLRLLASRVGWAAEPPDLSHLTVDRVTWTPPGMRSYAGTGRVFSGLNEPMDMAAAPLPAWPCHSDVRAATCDSESLFCQTIDCADAHARAEINDRLARAVLALKISTGASMSNYFAPSFADHRGSGTSPRPENAPSWIDAPGDIGGGQYTIWSAVNAGSSCYSDDLTSTCLGSRTYYGSTYCRSSTGTAPSLWTTLLANGTWRERPVTCGQQDPRRFIVFDARRHASADPGREYRGDDSDSIVPYMWEGVARGTAVVAQDSTPRLSDFQHFGRSTYARVLEDEWEDGDVVLGRDVERIDRLTTWFHDVDESEVAIAGNWSQAPRSGSFARGLTARDLRDALELACELDQSETASCDPSRPPPRVSTVADLPAVRAYLNCVGFTIQDRAQRAVIPNVPRGALRGLSADGGGGFDVARGSYGVAVDQLRRGLENMSMHMPRLAQELRGFARDIERMENLIIQTNAIRETQELTMARDIFHALNSCGGSVMTALIASNNGPDSDYSGWGNVVTQCGNAAATVITIIAQNRLSSQIENAETRSQMLQLEDGIEVRIATFRDIQSAIATAVGDLQDATAELASLRRTGRRSVGRMLLLDMDETGRAYRTNTVYRRRYNTTLTRYRRALRQAVRSAFLARRAIEQQIGLDLNSLSEPMTLVEPPRTWADTICDVTGIDYSRLRDSTDLDYENYADQYVGDYVDRLEAFVESYRIDFPFQDATDTTVISLRHESSGGLGACDSNVPNLLAYTGHLEYATYPLEPTDAPDVEPEPLWEVSGCTSTTSCVAVTPVTGSPEERPVPSWHPQFATAAAFDVLFAQDDGDPATPIGYTSQARLNQQLALSSGRYRVSWYAVDADGSGLVYGDPAGASSPFEIEHADGSVLARSALGTAPSGTEWVRRYFVVEVPSGEPLYLALRAANTALTTEQRWRIAAPMIENVGATVPANATIADHPPGFYVETEEAGRATVPVCDVGPGSELRWARRCQTLCPTGLADSCEEGDSGVLRCFWEARFDVPAEAIRNGSALASGGFAEGNFNYRVDALGVNFVGANVRYCEAHADPDLCYSAGWVPYTLIHDGEHRVLNYFGDDNYAAPINTGRIEHARGLAAERYVTNPISSADQSLMEPYMQRQLRGRPLTGSYVLRVWDTPGVTLTGVEDVQVVLRYRFWTRQRR
ncbi:hypothetical protein [Sandaracinus amylolyticus]|nr:hypothetical protein [Sandaracinus amylolyticus]